MTHASSARAAEERAAAAHRKLTIEPVNDLLTVHDKEGDLVAAYTGDGNLIGGALHRELLHLTAHKNHNRAVSAQRDAAVENARAWRRFALVLALVLATAITIGMLR